MDAETMEILRGVLAVAVADGEIRRSEKGVMKGLAARLGIDRAWLDEMIRYAEEGASVESSMFRRILSDPTRAMRLMVATAAVDGDISDQERSVLVDISLKIGLAPGKFGEVFAEGMAAAERLRRDRKRPAGH
jgi:tellurite resistance protein